MYVHNALLCERQEIDALGSPEQVGTHVLISGPHICWSILGRVIAAVTSLCWVLVQSIYAVKWRKVWSSETKCHSMHWWQTVQAHNSSTAYKTGYSYSGQACNQDAWSCPLPISWSLHWRTAYSLSICIQWTQDKHATDILHSSCIRAALWETKQRYRRVERDRRRWGRRSTPAQYQFSSIIGITISIQVPTSIIVVCVSQRDILRAQAGCRTECFLALATAADICAGTCTATNSAMWLVRPCHEKAQCTSTLAGTDTGRASDCIAAV